jgi:serine/threonine-protein kinase
MVPSATLTIGRYAFHAEIASGGMATVHLARLLGPGGFSRIVAAKRLLPHMVRDAIFTRMLLDEARLAARIRHPNVVSTLDVVSSDGELVIVMEYVHGESLAKLVRTASTMAEAIPPRLAASVIIDALHGLHAAHEARDEDGKLLGVVHRDVSPQNLLVGVDGITRVADFGIAKATARSSYTRDGTIKGKLSYMAPEQIERGELTRAADVFAISVVLWELFTGRQLFDGKSDAEVMHRIVTCQVPAPSSFAAALPKIYDQILARGLARDPQQRYPTAQALALALEAVTEPMRPSEIRAWVEHVAADSLLRRSHAIAKIEGTRPDEVSALAKTMPATSPSRPQPEMLSTSAPVSSERSSVARSSSWVWALAVASILGAVTGLFLFARERVGSHVTSGSAPAPSSPPVLPSVAAVVAVAAVVPSTSAVPAPASAAASAKPPSAPEPKLSPTELRPRSKARPSARPAPKTSPDVIGF